MELFTTPAVPTLTYGMELTNLSETQLKNIDIEGRKALKLLFNLSPYSKNYLNTAFNLMPISTIINNNKLKLLKRLMRNNATMNIILSILTTNTRYESLVWDCYNLSKENKLSFIDILLDTNEQIIKPIFPPLPDDVSKCINDTIEFWNAKEQRKSFRQMMEESILRY